MTATPEVQAKLSMLRELMVRRDLDALVLRGIPATAWVSGGGRTNIAVMQDIGVADIVVTADGVRVVTAVNEAPRLREEELAGLDAEFDVIGWDGSQRAARVPAGRRVGVDVPDGLGSLDVSEDILDLRRGLTAVEVARAEALGADAAAAMTAAALLVAPTDTEYAAAGHIAREVMARGADPVVVLVAGGSRLLEHRHALPTTGPLGPLAMLVVCARRSGLILSLTRFVAFSPLTAEQNDAWGRLLLVDVAFNEASVAGSTVGAAFRAGAEAYAAHGFDPDEWQLHHQGGPAGYAARDEIGTFASRTPVVDSEIFAWNPSVPGLKCEDSILTTAAGPRVLTADGAWPTRAVGSLLRPLVLER